MTSRVGPTHVTVTCKDGGVQTMPHCVSPTKFTHHISRSSQPLQVRSKTQARIIARSCSEQQLFISAALLNMALFPGQYTPNLFLPMQFTCMASPAVLWLMRGSAPRGIRPDAAPFTSVVSVCSGKTTEQHVQCSSATADREQHSCCNCGSAKRNNSPTRHCRCCLNCMAG